MDNSEAMKPPPDPHYRHRFPAEVISHAVWLYHVFSLSLRDVELILAERGIVVSYETVRRWCKKFGQSFANLLRRRRPRPGDKSHLDEVFIQIAATRTTDTAVQVARAGADLPFRSRIHPRPLPSTPPSADGRCVSHDQVDRF
jgi:transposase-like protein